MNYNVVLRKPKTKAAHEEVTKNHQANSILFPGNSYSLEPHLEHASMSNLHVSTLTPMHLRKVMGGQLGTFWEH